MDVWEARAVLGVGDADGWEVVRTAYRRLIREAHPDTAGATGVGATRRAARLNEAYTVLSRARRAGTLDRPGSPGGDRPGNGAEAATGSRARPHPVPPPVGTVVLGADTLLLAAPPDLAFGLLLEAAHQVGSISYVDRSCAIFEVVVDLAGEACSLVVSLQARGHGTEAFLTVESLERVASYSPEPVLHLFAAALG